MTNEQKEIRTFLDAALNLSHDHNWTLQDFLAELQLSGLR